MCSVHIPVWHVVFLGLRCVCSEHEVDSACAGSIPAVLHPVHQSGLYVCQDETPLLSMGVMLVPALCACAYPPSDTVVTRQYSVSGLMYTCERLCLWPRGAHRPLEGLIRARRYILLCSSAVPWHRIVLEQSTMVEFRLMPYG